MELHKKLLEVRKSVPYIEKESGEGFQFKYVSSTAVLAALRKAMDDQGLLLIPKVISNEVTFLDRGEGKAKAVFTELVMQYIWVNTEKPGEQIACSWYGQGIDFASERGVGKALTYAEKYFLLKFFNIPTDRDDPDSVQEKVDVSAPLGTSKTAGARPAAKKEEYQRPPEKDDKLLTEGQVKLVWARAYAKWDREEVETELKELIKGRYGVESTKEMTQKQLDDYLEFIDTIVIPQDEELF
jgi:hypothetical protein